MQGWILNKNEKKQILENPYIHTEITSSFEDARYVIQINVSYHEKTPDGLDIYGGLIKKFGGVNNLIKEFASKGIDLESHIIKALEQETSLIGFSSNLIGELKENKITYLIKNQN